MNRNGHIILTIILFVIGILFVYIGFPSDIPDKSGMHILGGGAIFLAIAQIPFLIKSRKKKQ